LCVMKYEAKQVGVTNVPISQASGNPWVNINQTTAITNSQNVAGCTGCHLMSEAEWMTLAQNVLSVPSNWNTGIVGNGFIYSGHNDGMPNNSLAAAVDTDTYSGTGQSSGDQRRTLTLTNGEVIWDLSGNVHEWTSGQYHSSAPDVGNTFWSFFEWKDTPNESIPNSYTIDSLVPNPYPVATGIVGADSWTVANGIGALSITLELKGVSGFSRGGYWGSTPSPSSKAGVLSFNYGGLARIASDSTGFRVAR